MTFLTKVQQETLRGIRNGLRNKDIAKNLDVRADAVSKAISDIYKKAMFIQKDANLLLELGYFEIIDGNIEVAVEDGDPRLLAPKK